MRYTCTQCTETSNCAPCLFDAASLKAGKPICKKCAGTAKLEEVAEIHAVQKEAQQKMFASWNDLAPGGTLTFADYGSNADTRHAMRRFSDSHNVAIQTECNGATKLQKSIKPQKYGQIAIKNMARGIGDSVTAIYAACGIADAGFEVYFYDVHPEWLTGVKYHNVHIIDARDCPIPDNAIDLNLRYNEQLSKATCRKEWYCDNFKLAKGISEFDISPVAPDVNLDIRNKRNGQDYVVIAPCSNDSARFWDKAKWVEVAGLLKLKGLMCMAIGNSDQAHLIADIFKPCGNVDHLLNASPNEVAELMLQSRGFIGVDSGMTHYAGLLGVNAVGISVQFPASLLWGMTEIRGYRADATADEVVEALL